MIGLATVVLAFSLAMFGGWIAGHSLLPWYVSLSGVVLAAVVFLSGRISTFLRIFIMMYALGYLFIGGLNGLSAADLLPKQIKDLLPPAFMALAATCFAVVVFGVAHMPVIRTIMKLADPYFESSAAPGNSFGWFSRLFRSEGYAARAMVGIIIAGNFIQVALTIRLNLWYRDVFDAFQARNAEAFWYQIWGIFLPLLIFWIIFQMLDLLIDSVFDIRWREWLSKRYFTRWLDDGTHYQMQTAGIAADNPDQRISVDVRQFVSQTMNLSVRLLSQAVSLVSFTVILWGISTGFTLPGTDMIVPGFLVWVALLYAITGTIITHFIGRPLIKLDFQQEKYEANFRFGLARLREYGEQVALLKGGRNEQVRLHSLFGSLVINFFDILKRKLKLVGFSFSWQQISVAFPYILIGPYYFAQKVTLGQMQQGASAFGRVEGALSFFITQYQTLASYKAVIDRLSTFNAAMSSVEEKRKNSGITLPSHASTDVSIPALSLAVPSGETIVTIRDLTLKPGQSTLVTGPSGSGKSTLFRAVAGIWPFGNGAIHVPDGKSVMLLPQRPYIPMGTLREAVQYPGLAGDHTDEALQAALEAARLPKLLNRLDEEQMWAQVLSLGEQQRLAVARAILSKPDWLFLDEATAALDEATEAAIYDVIKQKLPATTIVSIGHRSTLIAMHDRQINLVAGDDGVFGVQDVKKKAKAK